jgi:hypothetical protein
VKPDGTQKENTMADIDALEARELFHEILADFRDYPQDPGFDQRTGFEMTRRERYRRQRLGLKAS